MKSNGPTKRSKTKETTISLLLTIPYILYILKFNITHIVFLIWSLSSPRKKRRRRSVSKRWMPEFWLEFFIDDDFHFNAGHPLWWWLRRDVCLQINANTSQAHSGAKQNIFKNTEIKSDLKKSILVLRCSTLLIIFYYYI